jgi:hypothetical protein
LGQKIIIPGPAQEIPAKSNMCCQSWFFFKEKLFQFSIFHYWMSLVPNFERFGEFPFVHLKFNLFWLWSEGQQMEVNI